MLRGIAEELRLLASRQGIEPERTVLNFIFRYRAVPFTVFSDIFTVNSG